MGAVAAPAPLLDWLGVPTGSRFTRESALDGDDEASLRGLVLLDLPDFDSIEEAHRLEVDRLLRLVDLVVWVLDPQKYADRVVHEQYLAQFQRPPRRHRGACSTRPTGSAVTDIERVSTDLRRLLDSRRPRRGAGAADVRDRPARDLRRCAPCWSAPSPHGRPRCSGSPAT